MRSTLFLAVAILLGLGLFFAREGLRVTLCDFSEEAVAHVRRAAESGEKHHLIFADPPYAKKPGDTDHAAQLLQSAALHSLLEPGGTNLYSSL